MSFVPFLMLQVAIFIGLVVALRLILKRNLTDAAARLQSLSVDYTRRHEELKQRLTEGEQQYREQMARAKAEAEQLVARTKQETEAGRAQLLEDAHLESERIVQQALESRDALRNELQRAMEARALERACELIQETLPGELRHAIQARWLEELLRNGLAELDRLKADEALSEARVVSAFPLEPAQREALRGRLLERLGREIAVTEEVDERLVAGLTITLGSLVLDGSLSSRVRAAARHAQSVDGSGES